MKHEHRPITPAFTFAAFFLLACGGQTQARVEDAEARSDAIRKSGADKGQCEYEGRADREAVESAGPGAVSPNVRRVFGIAGEGEERRRILLCREIDTNLDGAKDVVRRYNERNEAVEEVADSNYDGKVDTWIRFANGRIAKVELDGNGDGQPDQVRYYIRGVLSRVQRDSNRDGKPDIWEIYADGRLERMGSDVDHDGHVDRWDRDEIARRASEAKEREEEERRQREEAEKAKESSDGAAASDAASAETK